MSAETMEANNYYCYIFVVKTSRALSFWDLCFSVAKERCDLVYIGNTSESITHSHVLPSLLYINKQMCHPADCSIIDLFKNCFSSLSFGYSRAGIEALLSFYIEISGDTQLNVELYICICRTFCLLLFSLQTQGLECQIVHQDIQCAGKK